MGERKVLVVLHLGRDSARGEGARLRSWQEIGAAASVDVIPVPLLRMRQRSPLEAARSMAGVALGTEVPERVSWSIAESTTTLASLKPDLVVCLTSRAWHPRTASAHRTVLDYVDRLSENYAGRAATGPIVSRLTYRLLALGQRRFERRFPPGFLSVAAGWRNARELRALWMPNVVKPQPLSSRLPTHDLVFVGTLSYRPNIEALRFLARAWRAIVSRRPSTTVLVAGASPGAEIRALVRDNGWHLAADFADATRVFSDALIAVAPLTEATGIQNKVLEASAAGLAQVVSPAAASGLDPRFPAEVRTSPDEFATACLGLLENEPRRRSLGAAGLAHVRQHYSPETWAPFLERLISGEALP